MRMNNLSDLEMTFRCDRLSVRMERLIDNFQRMEALSSDGANAETVLTIVRETKVFLELTALDLDVNRAFELAQIQRQLSRWHIHWLEVWTNDASRLEISTLANTWAQQLREIAIVLA
jgi:hypothetical protein